MTAKIRIAVLGALSLCLVAAGCAGLSSSFTGSKVSSAPIVPIKQVDSAASRWQTFDINIDYIFKRQDDVFDISGVAALSDHYELNYESLRDLRVFLFLLDADARVLQAVPVARSLTTDLDEKLDFKVSLKAPTGFAAFSFGYDGQAKDQRGGTSFYNLPLNK